MGYLKSAEGKVIHPYGEIKVKLGKTKTDGIDATISLPNGLKGIFIWKDKSLQLSEGEQKFKL